MPTEPQDEFVVEILGWDHGLHVQIMPDTAPGEHRFQGDLIYVRSIEIEGRVVSPSGRCAQKVRVWLSELPDHELSALSSEVGSVDERNRRAGDSELLVSLWAPQNTLEPATICLAASWRYLSFTTVGSPVKGAAVTSFSFARASDRTPGLATGLRT